MKEWSLVSIMIATFNSEKVLGKTLEAIRKQTYSKEKIEVLIIDGGSTDTTLNIAKKYNCIIHYNPKTEPVNAKLIGLQKAKGKYFVTIDHDEVIENRDSIRNKVLLLEKYTECQVALCSGYMKPNDYPKLNQYISDFGDPFSLYIYNFPKCYGFFEQVLKKNYIIKENKHCYMVVSFEKMNKIPLMELCCLGTMINREYFLKNTNAINDSSQLVHLFYIMLDNGAKDIIFSKNDPLVHYSVDSINAYLPKLKWRVCNNIHYAEKGEAGFKGRTKYHKYVKYKQILFIPYAISIIIPFIHGLFLSISRKNSIYLLHPFFSLYVAIQIIYQTFLKILNITPSFVSYDGKKKIER